MHIEFLVEEPSAEAFLRIMVPKILGVQVSLNVHVYNGKPDLLEKLPSRLRAYGRRLPADWRIVVLVDEDRQDCDELKGRLEKAAGNASLRTKTTAKESGIFQVLNRIAIEELEAWYFGDIQAIVAAYPGVSSTLDKKEQYRDPDSVKGGTKEALERVLKRAGYYPTGLPSIEAAHKITREMDVQRNRSHSFQVFRRGLLQLVGVDKASRVNNECQLSNMPYRKGSPQ